MCFCRLSPGDKACDCHSPGCLQISEADIFVRPSKCVLTVYSFEPKWRFIVKSPCFVALPCGPAFRSQPIRRCCTHLVLSWRPAVGQFQIRRWGCALLRTSCCPRTRTTELRFDCIDHRPVPVRKSDSQCCYNAVVLLHCPVGYIFRPQTLKQCGSHFVVSCGPAVRHC